MSELLASAGSEGYGARDDAADDPDAVDKLKAKLASLEALQDKMKAVNAYYRKHGALEGCPQLSTEEVEKLKADMARSWRAEPKPYESYLLTNNNANIRQTRARIAELEKKAETEYKGWAFDGGEVKIDKEANRLQVFFDNKPDRETCSAMRHGGFRWAPSVGAWQRQLNSNAFYAANHLDCIRPLSGILPTELQKGGQAEAVQETAQEGVGWRFYIIADLKTWADNAENRSPLERFDSFEAARTRFEELRGQDYNSEATEPGPDGQPPARLTLGLMSADGMSAADILHVRQGENYLVTDFTREERQRNDPAMMDILARISREIGFERVRVWEQADGGRQALSIVPFAEWDNPYFPSNTPGRFAARYYDFMHQCYPLQKDDGLRQAWIGQIVQYIQFEGKRGAGQLAQAVAGLAAGLPENTAVQESAAALIGELEQYQGPERAAVPEKKHQHKRSQER